MGIPLRHIPVKLIVGLISNRLPQFLIAKQILEKKFGKIDKETDLLDFSSHSHYYEKEFGVNLKRKFFSFKRLIKLRCAYKIKLYTNRVEKKLSKDKKRTINIDPGYITLAKLVLFTTKDSSHRIYIDRGIYGDLELQFTNKRFRPVEWTYSDYRSGEYIEFFNSVRAIYLSQVKQYL